MSTSSIETIWLHDALFRVHLDRERTGGAFELLEAIVPSGHMPPWHIHEREAESFLVLEGEITIHAPGGTTVLRPGDAGIAPAGEAHTYEVTSTGAARIVGVCAPAGFVDYLRAAGRPAGYDGLPTVDGPPDLARIGAAAAAHGVTILAPPGVTPAQFAGQGTR
jgi:mannose-6-phosphate isomerase-like protein (cupin superfamily)